ncbi:MAG TPA: Txe/YoeB family addiction module toxin [Thermoanaerobaculia bacterium]|nr:Txe/YoeB family addiction module toxin [Thermoanaerobaculia bacterium]
MRSLEFDPAAFQDLAWWVEQDRKKALKIMKLVEAIQRDPFSGIGQPESLKHDFAGCWSRRIDQEHRLVYEVSEEKIRILSCRYHY